MKLNSFLLLLILLAACKADVKDKRAGTHESDGAYIKFSDPVSGWSTRYPKSWHRLTPEEISKMEGKGEELLESAADQEFVINNTHLIWLKKDMFNSFTSTYEPYSVSKNGSFEENEKYVFQMLETAYRQNGMAIESKQGKAMLDGLEFITWECEIYAPDKSKVLMRQVMYGRLIDDRLSLTLNANYGNESDRDTLMAIINESKFAVRD
jgi:hypothetical protein